MPATSGQSDFVSNAIIAGSLRRLAGIYRVARSKRNTKDPDVTADLTDAESTNWPESSAAETTESAKTSFHSCDSMAALSITDQTCTIRLSRSS